MGLWIAMERLKKEIAGLRDRADNLAPQGAPTETPATAGVPQ
jgi:hypothetical protein